MSVGTGLDRVSVWAEGLDHPEGVTAGPDGMVYAGGEAGQVYRIDPADRICHQIASTEGFLLGLCCDGAANIFACDIVRKEVVVISGGKVRTYSAGTDETKMVNPNWPLFDHAGNLYVTDSGGWKQDSGCIFRIDAKGQAKVWCTTASNFPNGACLSADGTFLLVLESCTPALVRIEILPDGTAGERTVLADLPGTIPDGVTLDTAGNAYVFCYRPDRVLRVSPKGDIEVIADDPEGTALSAPTNGAWVDGDLIVGNLGRWHLAKLQLGLEGVPLCYPRLET